MQNYEDEDLPGEKLQDEMNEYLAEVIEDKGVKDLRDTREQVYYSSSEGTRTGIVMGSGGRCGLAFLLLDRVCVHAGMRPPASFAYACGLARLGGCFLFSFSRICANRRGFLCPPMPFRAPGDKRRRSPLLLRA